MQWPEHKILENSHALLGASKYHWIRYSEDELEKYLTNYYAAQRGTELHKFAADCIRLGQRLPKSKKTLNNYVNDAIGFRMKPEVVLYFSENCFGTADAISFANDQLRIHDLKTGVTPAKMDQLYIYAAMFCHEYRQKPGNIKIETRIYQSDQIIFDNPPPEVIVPIMDKIVRFDERARTFKEEVLGIG
jgi:hypothetical protein